MYSIGIGTSDYPDEGVTVNTSGGPPQLNVSSFLDDLTAADTSSPVRRTSVSVLSPILQRTFSIVSQRRPRLTIESGVNAVVCCSDVSLSACVDTADKEVQAVIETADGSTCYEPQVETSLSASPPVVDDTELLTPDANQTATFASAHSEAIIPEDPAIGTGTFSDVPAGITIADPSSAALDSETVPLHLELELAVTSPMGPSLLDSDDEPIASHLPGYLNSFKTCEVSDQYLHSFIFLFFILASNSDFSSFSSIFHRFSSFRCSFLQVMFFHHFLIVKSFQTWRFSLLSCILAILATFHLFYIFKIFLFVLAIFQCPLFSLHPFFIVKLFSLYNISILVQIRSTHLFFIVRFFRL